MMLTIEEFARIYIEPAIEQMYEAFERANPELMKRLRRNARRRERYAERKAA